MKKIYSFVLMAAMLLIGTNVNAENELSVGGNTYSTVQAAFNAAADGQTITLTGVMTDVAGATLEANKHIILDLGNNVLYFNLDADVDNAACITIKQGVLEIKNGEIENAKSDVRTQLIRVIGTTDAVDAATNPYSQVIVVKGAKLKNTQSNTSLTNNKFNVLEITEKSGTTFSNGARIDVYGEVEAQTYGIKVNGTIKKPAEETSSPYVYIHKGATVSANATAPSAAAAYSSGYARWIIEGECSGSTGLYAKSGDIDITGNITSTNTKNDPTTGKSSGIEAGGSAIVIESNKNYDGHIDVTISAGAQITATNGYAIEETVASDVNETKVEAVKIEGGSMAGGAGAIIVDEKTTGTSTDPTHKVTVVGGMIDGTIQTAGTTDTTAVTVEQFILGTTSTQELPAGQEPDYTVTKSSPNPSEPTVVYTVEPNTAKNVTLNAHGLATYSFENASEGVQKRALPSDWKAYTGKVDNGNFVLTEIEEGATDEGVVIPESTGVILYKENGDHAEGEMTLTTKTVSAISNNDLLAAATWNYTQPQQYVYVLVGNELYLYEGAEMKANKAYLKLDAAATPYGAPKRMKMVFAEPQDIENVEFEAVKAVKFIENGQVLIKRGEKVYNVQGQIVK